MTETMTDLLVERTYELVVRILKRSGLIIGKTCLGECSEGMSRTSQYALYDTTKEQWLTDDHCHLVVMSNYNFDKSIATVLCYPRVYTPLCDLLTTEIDRRGFLERFKELEAERGLNAFLDFYNEHAGEFIEFSDDFQAISLIATNRRWLEAIDLNRLYDAFYPNVTAARDKLFGAAASVEPPCSQQFASVALREALDVAGLRLKNIIGDTGFTLNRKATNEQITDTDSQSRVFRAGDGTSVRIAREYAEQPLRAILLRVVDADPDATNTTLLIDKLNDLYDIDRAAFNSVSRQAVLLSVLNQYAGYAKLHDVAQIQY